MSAYSDMADDTRGGMATILWTLAALLFCFALLATLCGCKTYYENAGMRVRAGEITAPIELSEPTSSTNIRFLFFLNGLDVYARRECNVRIKYTSVKVGNWLTSATTQAVEVVVNPVAASTNLCDSVRSRTN